MDSNKGCRGLSVTEMIAKAIADGDYDLLSALCRSTGQAFPHNSSSTVTQESYSPANEMPHHAAVANPPPPFRDVDSTKREFSRRLVKLGAPESTPGVAIIPPNLVFGEKSIKQNWTKFKNHILSLDKDWITEENANDVIVVCDKFRQAIVKYLVMVVGERLEQKFELATKCLTSKLQGVSPWHYHSLLTQDETLNWRNILGLYKLY
jgi:hypothetical protein